MLMVVANAEGLATGVPLLMVVVAFSAVRMDPVELPVVSAACEILAVSKRIDPAESFMIAL
jgi:hypothetical protein